MKLLKYGFYLLAIAASAVSCTRKDGDWDPIKTDCREITVPPQGGSAVVTMKNYKGWWISTVQYEAKGENLMIHGEDFRNPRRESSGFRIYEVRKRVVRNRRAVRKSEQIVYRPERERWTGAEENRYRNDGRRCFHKYRYYTGKCTSDHSERMILACILCIFLSYRRRRRLFGSK